MARKKGSKLSRTEVFNVRFDPKLKMAAELLAERERRTLSSLTEWVMERAVREMQVTTNADGQPVTAWQIADRCWEPSFVWRVYRLAESYPELLSHVGRNIYSLMVMLRFFEKRLSGSDQEPLASRIVSMIEPHIMDCAEGKIDPSELTKHYQEARIQFLAELYQPGKLQLRELADSGMFDQYQKAKELVLNLIGNP